MFHLPSLKKSLPAWACVATLLLFAACGGNNKQDAENPNGDSVLNVFSDSIRLRIAQIQHERKGADLLPYTGTGYPQAVRIAATMAFASIQDSSFCTQLENLLKDSDPRVQASAAFALGQTAQNRSASQLLSTAQNAVDTSLVVAAYEAFGKCASPSDLKSMMDKSNQSGSTALGQLGMVAALYRAGLRGVTTPGSEELALRLLETGQPKATFWAGAFLGRTKEIGPVKDAERLIRAFDRQVNPETRQLLVRRMGRCNAPVCLQRLEKALTDSSEIWPVKVNAVRALSELAPKTTPEAIFGSIEPLFSPVPGMRAHPLVAMEASLYLKTQGQPGDLARIERILNLPGCRSDRKYPTVQGQLMSAYVRLCKSDPNRLKTALDYVKTILRDAESPYRKGYAYLALAHDPAQESLLRQAVLPVKPVVSTYAMDGLSLIYNQNQQDLPARVAFLNQVLNAGDVGLTAQAALLIATDGNGLAQAMRDSSALHAALGRLQLPRDAETHTEVRKALDKIAGRKTAVVAPFPPSAYPVDWEAVRQIPATCKWKIQTDLGEIVIQLSVESAPATVANIVKLARAKAFDGLTFHRIVPNFVAQGGCPRGDGYGSCSPTLRSEFNGLRYSRGAVGMASSGKDTESCQFFITHSATPHLDGRYTVFGYVASGISVAERLEVGSRILSTTVE